MRDSLSRGERGDDVRLRLRNDPTFHHLFSIVYHSISSGDVTVTDWRDAVNLAFTEWHARNVSPIMFPRRDPNDPS